MRKNMKRILSGVLASVMMLSLTACGGGQQAGTSTAAPAGSKAEAGENVEAGGKADADNKAGGTAVTSKGTGADEKVVKIAYTSDPGSLGAFDEGSSSGRWTVLAYTYENLAYLDVDGQYYGILAKSWEKDEAKSSPTNAVWNVEIYDYITDSDGNKITADDVVFSFNECLENGKGNQHTALTGSLVSIEKTGDYSVQIICNSEAAGEVENMLTQVMIVSEKAYKESGDKIGRAHV